MSRVLLIGDVDALGPEGASRLLKAGGGERLIVAQPGLEVCNSVGSLPADCEVMLMGGRCTTDSCFVEQETETRCEERTCAAKRLWSMLQAVTRRGDLSCIAFASGRELDTAGFEYMSSPNTDVAKLCSLLFHRWRSLQPGARVLTVNAECGPETLRDGCVQQAEVWRRPMVFQRWLSEECTWGFADSGV